MSKSERLTVLLLGFHCWEKAFRPIGLGVAVTSALYGSPFFYPDPDPLSLVKEFSVTLLEDVNLFLASLLFDEEVSAGLDWHKQLLEQVAKSTKRHSPVIS